jgi:hypothetical protein
MPELTRMLKLGTVGADVDGWARAAHRYLQDGLLDEHEKQRPIVRRTFGPGKRTLAKQCAKKAGLPEYGVVGVALDKAMRNGGAYDQISDSLFTQYAASVEPPDPRDAVCDAARFYLEHARHIAYSQVRPILTVARGISPPDIPNALDCSGLAITAYWVAGVIDKLGWQNANGYGNTWTLAASGRSVRSDELRPGDLVFYGACSHVAIYEGGGKVITNGSYPMSRQRLMYRNDYYGARSYL